MPLPTSIDDLSTVPGDNFPAGTDSPDVLDNVIREHAAYIAELRDGQDSTIRDDLASSSSGNGAEMVANQNGGTVQEHINYATARIDDSRRVDLKTTNTAAQNAAELVAAMAGRYSAGGGTVTLPAGDFNIDSVAYNWNGAVTVNVKGQGPRATTLRKSGASADPVIDFSSSPGVLEVYSELSGFRIVGSATAPGLRATRLGRWDLRQVVIESCSVGFENVGSLVFNAYACTIQGNTIGYRSRKSGDGVRCNLINFIGGQISANSTFGMDIGDAASVNLYGTDLSANGTAANTATGAVLLRDTMDDETGFSNFTMRGGWFEANNGWTLRTENCGGLLLNIENVIAAGNEAGRVASIGSIFQSSIVGLIAGSASDTVNIAAARSIVSGGVIGTLNDTSTRYVHEGVSTSGGERMDARKGGFERHQLGTVDYLFGQASQISAGTADSVDHYLYGSGEQRFWAGGSMPLRLSGSGVGFNGATPSKPTVAAAATDPATTQALANDIRSKLIAMGLFV